MYYYCNYAFRRMEGGRNYVMEEKDKRIEGNTSRKEKNVLFYYCSNESDIEFNVLCDFCLPYSWFIEGPLYPNDRILYMFVSRQTNSTILFYSPENHSEKHVMLTSLHTVYWIKVKQYSFLLVCVQSFRHARYNISIILFCKFTMSLAILLP